MDITSIENLLNFSQQHATVLIIIAAVIMIGLFIWLNSVKPKNAKGSSSDAPKNSEKYLKDKVKFLMKNLGVAPFEYFELTDDLKNLLLSSCCDEMSIEKLVQAIFKHLDIPFKDTTVIVEFDEKYSRFNENDTGPAGTFVDLGTGQKEIHVVIKPSYSIKEVVAITCHECTHAFLFYKGIRISPVEENEMLTDTAAIYVGFGKHLLEGYQPISQVVGTEINATSTITRMKTASIGYMKIPQIRIVFNVVSKLRRKYGPRGKIPEKHRK